uniref:WD repeat-containing protein on Y chromosome n=1 Tax=Heliothis virescens TaxID=7102 RepID=A0A2A4JIS4_HELVI
MIANDGDLSMSQSSNARSDSTGPTSIAVSRTRNVPLHDRCSMSDMAHLKAIFESAYRNKLQANEFRTVLRTLLNVEYDDEEFKILFLKINTSRTGEMDWDELVSHLILGYFGNDAENQREALQPPIMGLPVILRSQHRHPISRICFCPDVAKDRSTDPMQGCYVTASRDGMINWWSLDMAVLRTGFSTSPHLKVRTTWVTDMVCMPDVNIIVTSSTERDLRFYDCTAKTFILKIIITSWEYMICTMFYYFDKDDIDQCKLICGDAAGNVRVLLFSARMRGPFRNDAGRALRTLRHVDLQKRPHTLPELRLVDLVHLHPEWVRQVSYYASLHCVVSCATCPDSLLMCDLEGSKTHYMFRVEKGIQCFAFEEETHVLVTGGPDCVVRVWNPFVPAKPSVTFYGHHAAITCLVLQEKGQIVYSLSRDRTIKVWDVQSQVCRQTYIDIPAVLGERTPISAVYNPATREFILAAIKIAIVVLDEQLNPLHTDGFTHSRAVALVLYNPLFKVIITCGTDSIIINWNPVTGKRNVLIRDAHTRLLHGELIPVEITASCFDPGYQLMLTGARSGELKVWNFNTGVCMRTMTIEYMCEVTNCFWVDRRILAIGWNRRVVEFEDSVMSMHGKSWETRHTDDVLAAAVRPPLTLATASYNSELVLWKLETGQPYRRFSCTEPTLRIKMHYGKREPPKPAAPAASPRKSITPSFRKPTTGASRDNVDPSAAIRKATARRVSTVSMPVRAQNMRHLAVHAMIFLHTRPMQMNVASLLLALENGTVQCWSDHSAGGYQGSFQVIHMAGDYAACLTTDDKNEFLFTGTTQGYLKVWLLSNYLINDTVHVNMPRLRLMFPFLWRDRIEGRAKRSTRDQPKPLLLNSYRAHLRCISSIAYIDELKLVFTGSSDYSVRVWRLSGEYLQTLGSFLPWTLEVTRFPPDVKKIASFTTFKVWRGGYVSRYVPGQKEVDKLRDITDHELRHKTYGAPPKEPLLGQYFTLPVRPERQDPIVLDDSLPTIPLYSHLRMASTQPVRRPPTPELVCETRLKRAKPNTKRSHLNLDVEPHVQTQRLSNPHNQRQPDGQTDASSEAHTARDTLSKN